MAGSSVGRMRCPACTSLDDKVVDSRLADDGAAIRRRRECLACGRRFTTFERTEEAPLTVVKRSGDREPFARAKIVAGMQSAAKNRPVTVEQMEQLGADLEEAIRSRGGEATSEEIGLTVLEPLRGLTEGAYLRLASVYKGFSVVGDFEREAGLLSRPGDKARNPQG